MDIKYDKKVNSLYISLSNGKVAETTKLNKVVIIDKNIKNNILGIEIIGNQFNKNFFKGV